MKLRLSLLLFSLWLLGSLSAMAQTNAARYVVNYTGTALMVHLPAANGGNAVRLVSAYISCASACTITERIRTDEASGGSAGTKVLLTLKNSPNLAVATEGPSNGTTGTTLFSFSIAAGGHETLNLRNIEFTAGKGFSIVSTSSAAISLTFEEF